jgi:GT2 family glycosyltransferase
MKNPKVYVVILNYKHWQDTRDCILSLMGSSYTRYHILVVDNNSGNNSLEELSGALIHAGLKHSDQPAAPADFILIQQQQLAQSKIDLSFHKITLIQNDRNDGFAAGNNIALRLPREEGSYVWLLNPDMIVQEHTMTALVRYAEQLGSRTIVGADVRYWDDKEQRFFYGGGKVHFFSGPSRMLMNPDEQQQLDYISGGCLFTATDTFNDLGLLPEDYFLYWEETEWCYRAKQEGYVLSVCPEAVCYDKISTIIGKGFISDYYYARNGLYFISRFKRKAIPSVLFFMSIRWLKRLMSGQGKRAKGIRWGTIDFLRGKKGKLG